MPYVQAKPAPETRKPRLTEEEKAFARYLAKGLPVRIAAVRIGRSERHGFRMLARLREVHGILTR